MPIATLNATTAVTLTPDPPPNPSIKLPPIDPQLQAASGHDGHGTGLLITVVRLVTHGTTSTQIVWFLTIFLGYTGMCLYVHLVWLLPYKLYMESLTSQGERSCMHFLDNNSMQRLSSQLLSSGEHDLLT